MTTSGLAAGAGLAILIDKEMEESTKLEGVRENTERERGREREKVMR